MLFYKNYAIIFEKGKFKMKIWAKILKEEKIKKSVVIDTALFDVQDFSKYVAEICEKLDLSCPIVLNYHVRHFNNLGLVSFKPNDFIESVDFDQLFLEIVKEKKSKSKDFYANL